MILDNKSDWDASSNNMIIKQDDDDILGIKIINIF
jgi:hypothetical protein